MATEIIQFLLEKPGYAKSSPKTLKTKFPNLSINQIKEAQSEIRKELQTDIDNQYEPLTLKSKWEVQTKGGGVKTLKSYRNDIKPQDIAEFRKELIEDIAKFAPSVPPQAREEIESPFAYEISLPDIHIGKGNTEEIKDAYLTSIAELMRRIDVENLDRIILPIGNDGLNSEGLKRATTKGTPQFDSLDWRESYRIYWQLLVSAITWLREFAPVDVICVPGNHDYERFYYLTDVLEAWFRDTSGVNIHNNSDDRKYYEYGNCMLMFTHGEKEKPKDMAMNMPVEQPEMFARTKFHEVHCGHFHKEMVLDEFKKIKVRFIPSICTTDNWHNQHGFLHLRAAQGFIWNYENGFEGFNQVNICN